VKVSGLRMNLPANRQHWSGWEGEGFWGNEFSGGKGGGDRDWDNAETIWKPKRMGFALGVVGKGSETGSNRGGKSRGFRYEGVKESLLPRRGEGGNFYMGMV